MATIRSHYDNLKVARDAPSEVIKAAYKVLCQTYHLDFNEKIALFRAFIKAATERSTSATVVAHEHTLILMTDSPFQTDPPHQHSPDFWMFSSVALVCSGLSQVTRI